MVHENKLKIIAISILIFVVGVFFIALMMQFFIPKLFVIILGILAACCIAILGEVEQLWI